MTAATRYDDAFSQVLSGFRPVGAGYSTTYSSAEIYAQRGIAATIIDRPAEDCMARGLVIENDTEGRISAEMDRLNVVQVFIDAMRNALLSGAAAVLPLMDDAASMLAPLSLDRLRRVRALVPYSAAQISAKGDQKIGDPSDPAYGEPVFYTLRPANGANAFDVHHSRLLRVPGEPIPLGAHLPNLINLPWIGRPLLDACMDEITHYAEARRWLLRVLERKQQAVYKMQGMAETLATQSNGENLVRSRLALVDQMRSLLNTVAVDGEDDFSITDLGVGGMDAALNEFRIALASAARMPVAILFGEPSKGIGNTGAGEMEIYHGRIEQLRGRSLRAPLERLVEIIVSQDGFPREGEWKVTFPALWSPSAKELAETRKIVAEAEAVEVATTLALQTGGLTSPEESRKHIADSLPERNLAAALPEGLDDFEPEPVTDPLDGPPAPF